MTEDVPKAEGNLSKEATFDLKAEWNKQAQNLARLFAKELGLTEEEYIATLPKFEPQPEEYKGRLDIPVIVETRVPLKRMLELAGIITGFDANLIKDWEEGNFNTPEKPYTTWLNDGSANLNKSVADVRAALRDDERGGTVFDAVALYLKDPKILDHHFPGLPGSQVNSPRAIHAIYFGRWPGAEKPRLDCCAVDSAHLRYGSIVAGRKINVLAPRA